MPEETSNEEVSQPSLEGEGSRQDAEAFVQLMRRTVQTEPEDEFEKSFAEVFAESDAEIEAKEKAEDEAKGIVRDPDEDDL